MHVPRLSLPQRVGIVRVLNRVFSFLMHVPPLPRHHNWDGYAWCRGEVGALIKQRRPRTVRELVAAGEVDGREAGTKSSEGCDRRVCQLRTPAKVDKPVMGSCKVYDYPGSM